MNDPRHAPTPEQFAILQSAAAGAHLQVIAGAGTGKTATLLFLASARPQLRSLYLAFNKSVAVEAARKFAGTGVVVKTMHALAYASHGAPMQHRSMRYLRPAEQLAILGVEEAFPVRFAAERSGTADVGEPAPWLRRTISRTRLLQGAWRLVDAFLSTDTPSLDAVPVALDHDQLLGGAVAHPEDAAALEARIRAIATDWWRDLTDPAGRLQYSHAAYFKAWALAGPQLPFDVLFLDEAQDTDQVLLGVLRRQQRTQIIAVGDTEQAIYGWRGATDALSAFDGATLHLTQAFRFGEAIAAEANWWLSALDGPIRLQGLRGKPSRVGQVARPDAIICRTNAGVLAATLAAQGEGRRVHVVGERKMQELTRLAEGCVELQDVGKSSHPDLKGFTSWAQVRAAADEGEAPTLAPLLALIDQHGAAKLLDVLAACVGAHEADLHVATVHVAKGLEWEQVRLHGDFLPPGFDEDGAPRPIPTEELRIIYVAVTRARSAVDVGQVAFLRAWPGGARTAAGEVRELPSYEGWVPADDRRLRPPARARAGAAAPAPLADPPAEQGDPAGPPAAAPTAASTEPAAATDVDRTVEQLRDEVGQLRVLLDAALRRLDVLETPAAHGAVLTR